MGDFDTAGDVRTDLAAHLVAVVPDGLLHITSNTRVRELRTVMRYAWLRATYTLWVEGFGSLCLFGFLWFFGCLCLGVQDSETARYNRQVEVCTHPLERTLWQSRWMCWMTQ